MEKRSDGHLFVGRMGTFLVGWAYVKKYTMKIMKYNANILKQRRLRTRHLNPMFIGTITTTVQNPNILKIELHTSHNLITQHNVLYLIPVARGGGVYCDYLHNL